MKKISQSLLLVIALCTVTSATCSCGNPKKQIKKVAYAYLDAMANYRVDDAEQYCTYETQITTIATSRRLVAAVDSGYIESDTPAKVTIKKITMTSDTSAIVSFHKTTPIKNQNGELEMVLRDGKWMANVVLHNQLKRLKEIENGTYDPNQDSSAHKRKTIDTQIQGFKAVAGKKKKVNESDSTKTK